MSKPTVDPKRTGIKATVLDGWPEDGYAEPGGILWATDKDGNKVAMVLACPGCGEMGSMDVGHPKPQTGRPSWDVTGGSMDDVATLTLAPSIHCKGCCGWHGYLVNGVFQSC